MDRWRENRLSEAKTKKNNSTTLVDFDVAEKGHTSRFGGKNDSEQWAKYIVANRVQTELQALLLIGVVACYFHSINQESIIHSIVSDVLKFYVFCIQQMIIWNSLSREF